MKKIILIGHVACGKTTLCRRLNGLDSTYKKTQAIEVINETIDTPGEYLERRTFVRSLIMTSVECDLAIFVQDATAERFMFSPGMAGAFPIPVAGIVTKTDIANEDQISQARQLLELAGASPIFNISAVSGQGMEELIEYLS
jgi:ethanolamine utilization protein EutP